MFGLYPELATALPEPASKELLVRFPLAVLRPADCGAPPRPLHTLPNHPFTRPRPPTVPPLGRSSAPPLLTKTFPFTK